MSNYNEHGDGLALDGTASSFEQFLGFADAKTLPTATSTTVNAMFVSGVVPSRDNQTYGGLTRFVHLLEDWSTTGVSLNLNGSFVQLNFSNYATAPYDQDAWEPGASASAANLYTNYFVAPATLNLQYDTAVQYVPPGMVALRLAERVSTRDEVYREVAANDPYICRLRTAIGAPCP